MRVKSKFELQDWYSGEAAKRSFGRICQAVNEESKSTNLLGSKQSPLLILDDASWEDSLEGEVVLAIDEAKSDWSAVINAAMLGTRFRIKGRKVDRAVLYRLPDVKHPAEKYLRSPSAGVNRIALQLEDLANEIRKLPNAMKRVFLELDLGDFSKIIESLGRSSDLIDRRFRELWRVSEGLSAQELIAQSHHV